MKLILNFVVAVISGWLCVGCLLRPQYYESTDTIRLAVGDVLVSRGISRTENWDMSLSRQNNWIIPIDPMQTTVVVDGEQYSAIKPIPLKRSYSDKTVIIKKAGFKDYELNLTSQWTDEKWATAYGSGDQTQDVDTSSWGLFVPTHTLESVLLVPVLGIGILYLPGALLVDIYDLLIGGPSTVIMNPWRSYNIQEEQIILEPTNEYKTLCHKNKNSLITNRGCVDCDSAERMIASPEECARCSNRIMDERDKTCVLKTKKEIKKHDISMCHNQRGFMTEFGCIPCNTPASYQISVALSEDECRKCGNRFVRNNLCEDKVTQCKMAGKSNLYDSDSKTIDCNYYIKSIKN